MLASSREHLAAAGETYFQHMRFAGAVGLMALGAGIACLIHALVPALCQTTCSRTIGLLQVLFRDRAALGKVTAQASGAMTFAGLVALAALVGVAPVAAGVGPLFGIVVFALGLAIPSAFLLTNPELEPVADA